jgi:hypothetical protein
MEPQKNPFETSMVWVQKKVFKPVFVKDKDNKPTTTIDEEATAKVRENAPPDTSNFSVEGYEVQPDEYGLARVPDWAAKRLESHGFVAVDKDDAIAAEKARRAAQSKK